MTDIERIEHIVKWQKISLNAFAKELNLRSPQVFYDIRKGRHGISKDLANIITAKYLNIDKVWLLTGEGEMLKTTPSPNRENDPVETDINKGSEAMSLLRENFDFFKEQIRVKDEQIKEKDAQINKLQEMLDKRLKGDANGDATVASVG